MLGDINFSQMAAKKQQEQQRELVALAAEDFHFKEVSTVKESSNEIEEIKIKTIKKGVFRNKEGYCGIFCKFIDSEALTPSLKKIFANRHPVRNIYEGERFLLCLTKDKIHSFNIDYYKMMMSIIKTIDVEFPLKQREITIGIDKEDDLNVCLIETEIATFGIAGLRGSGVEEEERVILSNKLEKSQPFFKFKSPIYFEWSKLIGDKDRQFERICELLLQKEKNIIRVIPIGKTRASDRGRDFEVVEKDEGLGNVAEQKWLVQCKFSEHSVAPTTIAGWTDRVLEHKYAGYWLMTNNDITPSLFDQLKDVEKNNDYNIQVRFWQRSDFHIKLNVNSELFIKGDIFDLT